MIAAMTKYSMLVYHREYEDFLEKLRELGVVHILEKEIAITDEIREKYQLIDRVEKVIRFLKKREAGTGEADETLDGSEIFQEVTDLQNRLDQISNNINSLRKEINELQPWGDFSIGLINQLRDNGIILRFYSIQTRRFDQKWKEEYAIEEISTRGGQVYFVVISRDNENVDIQAEEVTLPTRSLSSLKDAHVKLQKEVESIESRFTHLARTSLPALENYKNNLTGRLDYEKTVYFTTREADDRLMILEGWVPSDSVAGVNEFLDKTGAAYITAQPSAADKVPVLLKNKGFAQKFEKLGELYSLPNYKEMDITPFFAPFYALFFGFCLGDAGYGILIAAGAMIARQKVGSELKPMALLVFYLGLSTILFGLLGGTFFGINLYLTNLPIYRDLSVMFREQGTDVNMLLFYLSIILGAIQIMFGMFLKAVNETIQFGWKFAVGTYGWITLIIGSLLVYLASVVTGVSMEQLRPVLYVVIAVASVMILLLNNLNRNILANFGLGLWNTYNMATGLLGDLLSYIRLFALGISSAILGFVFNSLALSMSGSVPVVSAIVMIIILLFGHGINLFMSGLGAFVHPMRLTFVEFYKNAGFSGGGKKYNPFRKIN
jgi:V/A-type H+/Na+-transporting ATPase subunit I